MEQLVEELQLLVEQLPPEIEAQVKVELVVLCVKMNVFVSYLGEGVGVILHLLEVPHLTVKAHVAK